MDDPLLWPDGRYQCLCVVCGDFFVHANKRHGLCPAHDTPNPKAQPMSETSETTAKKYEVLGNDPHDPDLHPEFWGLYEDGKCVGAIEHFTFVDGSDSSHLPPLIETALNALTAPPAGGVLTEAERAAVATGIVALPPDAIAVPVLEHLLARARSAADSVVVRREVLEILRDAAKGDRPERDGCDCDKCEPFRNETEAAIAEAEAALANQPKEENHAGE